MSGPVLAVLASRPARWFGWSALMAAAVLGLMSARAVRNEVRQNQRVIAALGVALAEQRSQATLVPAATLPAPPPLKLEITRAPNPLRQCTDSPAVRSALLGLRHAAAVRTADRSDLRAGAAGAQAGR